MNTKKILDFFKSLSNLDLFSQDGCQNKVILVHNKDVEVFDIRLSGPVSPKDRLLFPHWNDHSLWITAKGETIKSLFDCNTSDECAIICNREYGSILSEEVSFFCLPNKGTIVSCDEIHSYADKVILLIEGQYVSFNTA